MTGPTRRDTDTSPDASSQRPSSPHGASTWDSARSAASSRWDAVSSRFETVRSRARRTRTGWLAWRIGVTVLGIVIVAGGIVLLPLPGPGWVIIFAGLGVLATEYDRAGRLLTWVREQVTRWTRWLGTKPKWVSALVGLAIFAIVLGALYVVYLLR